MSAMQKLLDFLTRLERAHIHYALEHNRDDAIMVNVATPGERWEIEFFADGHTEVEIFRSTDEGVREGDALLEELLAREAEPGRPGSFEWVKDALLAMQTVRVGMTRADLLRTFETEGGVYTRRRRAYVYRGCPYFKVFVQFSPAGEEAGVTLDDDPRDLITEISKPYLEFGVTD
jgi:hypothetical protein